MPAQEDAAQTTLSQKYTNDKKWKESILIA